MLPEDILKLATVFENKTAQTSIAPQSKTTIDSAKALVAIINYWFNVSGYQAESMTFENFVATGKTQQLINGLKNSKTEIQSAYNNLINSLK